MGGRNWKVEEWYHLDVDQWAKNDQQYGITPVQHYSEEHKEHHHVDGVDGSEYTCNPL